MLPPSHIKLLWISSTGNEPDQHAWRRTLILLCQLSDAKERHEHGWELTKKGNRMKKVSICLFKVCLKQLDVKYPPVPSHLEAIFRENKSRACLSSRAEMNFPPERQQRKHLHEFRYWALIAVLPCNGFVLCGIHLKTYLPSGLFQAHRRSGMLNPQTCID